MKSLFTYALQDPQLSATGRTWITICDAVFSALPAGVAVLDGAGRVVALNRQWEEIVGEGYESHLIPDPSHSYADVAHALGLWGAEDARKVTANIKDIVSGRLDRFCQEISVQLGSSMGWHRVSLVPLDRESFDGVVAMHVDVTEERRLREELQRFMYIASHDLQEPLRTIASYLQLIERRYKGQLGQDGDDFIDYAVHGAKRLSTLIRDLLSYSRLTTGGHVEDTDVNMCVAEAVHSLEASIAAAGAVVEVGAMPRVMLDPVQVTSLFQNMIGNAIKYRAPNRTPHIRVTAQAHRNFWEFSVADNGIGIAVEYHDKIFEMFQRLCPQDGLGGTGVGLAIAKRIVEQAGGRLRVSSREGEGACFHFTLPAAAS